MDNKNYFENELESVFDSFSIYLTMAQANLGGHVGECSDDIKDLMEHENVIQQFSQIHPDLIATELEGFGTWDGLNLKLYDKYSIPIRIFS